MNAAHRNPHIYSAMFSSTILALLHSVIIIGILDLYLATNKKAFQVVLKSLSVGLQSVWLLDNTKVISHEIRVWNRGIVTALAHMFKLLVLCRSEHAISDV